MLARAAHKWVERQDFEGYLDNAATAAQVEDIRRSLGVRRRGTPRLPLFAEVGELPVSMQWLVRITRFWNKAVKERATAPHSIFARTFVSSCFMGQQRGNENRAVPSAAWASQVQAALAGIGITVDLAEPEYVPPGAVREAAARTVAVALQRGHGTRTREYVAQTCGGAVAAHIFLTRARPVLSCRLLAPQRRALARWRVGDTDLEVEAARWDRPGCPRVEAPEGRWCPFCSQFGVMAVEDLEHHVFDCPAVQEARDASPFLFSSTRGPLPQFLAGDEVALASFALHCRRLRAQAVDVVEV